MGRGLFDDGGTAVTDLPHLYGAPGAENLYHDIDTAWDLTDGATIEEYAARSTMDHLPPVDRILEWIVEWVSENGEVDEGGESSFDNATRHSDVVNATIVLRAVIASHVTYYMAGDLIRTHHRQTEQNEQIPRHACPVCGGPTGGHTTECVPVDATPLTPQHYRCNRTYRPCGHIIRWDDEETKQA